MSFLLDTNVVSEWAKPRPSLSVVRWLDEVDEEAVHLSSLTLGELREGVEGLVPGRRRDQLDRWLALDLPERFAGRVLPVDAAVAERWGALRASTARTGRTLAVVDALIAATALEQGFAVVTRNVRDFRDAGVRLVNPWTEAR
jgi:toxin FitB